METMGSLRRTNYCGEVSMSNVGQEMTVCGSIARARDKGGIIFADLRDTTGILQLVFDEDTPLDLIGTLKPLIAPPRPPRSPLAMWSCMSANCAF